MKKLAIAFSFLLVGGTMVHSQDLKKAKAAYTLASLKPENLETAKTEVDKLMTDDKTKSQAESYLLKMQTYSAIAASDQLADKYPDALNEAKAALDKYLELEPSEEKLKASNYDGINGLYNTYFKKGVKHYNAQEWEKAFDNFKGLATMGDLLIARKWSTAAFDTTSNLYAAVTAQNAKKEDEAVKYYTKLADINISGKDYEGVYEYLTKYYLNNPNDDKFNKHIAQAKQMYPDNKDLWNDIEFEYIKRTASLNQMMKKFDEADAAGTLSADDYSAYGNFFVSDDKVRDLPEADRTPYSQKAMYAFGKAYTKDTTNGVAAYNAGVTSYGRYEIVADSARQIKGTTADIKAKQAAAKKVANAAADHAIEWMEKAFRALQAKTERSSLEKNLANKSVDLLYNLYEYKREMSRGVNPKDYDAYDAKMNYYNSLHNKF